VWPRKGTCIQTSQIHARLPGTARRSVC